MADYGSLPGKEEKTIDIERKDTLLDELNLPPKVTRFIRANARALQIVAGCVVVLVFVWTYYDYYAQNKADNASSALSLALHEVDTAKRVELLQNVEADFSGTGSALWSRIELAHIDFKSGNYEDALNQYLDIVSDIDDDSPLLPLLSYNIGLAYENSNNNENALKYYAELARLKGFEIKGLMAQGRLYEALANSSAAIRVYQEVLSVEGLSGQEQNVVSEKIKNLQGATGTLKQEG
jgi:predicted negative regulator of RcsB-dependent stress response